MKLAVIGGGSTYTPELIDGIIVRHKRLPVTHIYLVDIEESKLEIIANFAKRMIAAAKIDITIEYGTDLRAGVRGASFVVSQFRVGTQAARHRDELLGRKYNLVGQETVGVGGFAKALRTIPVALNVARTILEEAPNAILLNFTNPAGLITQALIQEVPELTTIGLCNVPWNTRIEIADALGVASTSVNFDYVGLNHLSWIRGVTVDGVDTSTAAIKAFRGLTIEKGKPGDSPAWTQSSIDLLQAIPNYYLSYYYSEKAWVEYQTHNPTRASEVMKIEAILIEKFRDESLVTKPEELMQRGGAYYSDSAAELMSDIYNNAGTTHIVNTLNNGAVPDFPDDAVMEIPSIITSKGAASIKTGAMRGDIDSLVRTVKDFERLTISAAVNGDEDCALRALITNPIGPDISDARELWADLKKENAGMIGAFNG
ncbi:MAG: 6-phospho-beta-glucosidase [Streptomycetaceae bacterium]|nr:MAG: 6-phospho-beta-glucosidase [Streptomycetaceae bacterium]